ncbi:MAG: hypothetical protein ABFD25_22735 [Clostridiaceae bacterium]
MAYVPANISFEDTSQEKRLDRLDGGLNVKYRESLISDLQSPYMMNLNADDRGALTKRDGQTEFHTFNGGPVHGLFYYKSKFICAHSTKLSSWDGVTETLLLDGIADNDGVFFIVADILLYFNGNGYIQYNGVAAQNVEGYVPTLTINRQPTGGGTKNEVWNLFSPAFYDSFRGDGTSTAYTLSLSGLDETAVIASIDGGNTFDKTEGTHFSVNRVTGVVTWNTAPPDGRELTYDNVKIKACKTFAGMVDMVKKCRIVAQYGGGSNDSRIFIAGADLYPNVYRYSGLTGNAANDYRYFPETNYNRIGSDFKYITGFAKYYAKLVIFKEDSIFSVAYTYNASTGSSFPVQQLNAQIGCDMPGTVQIINNAPVFCHTQYGAYTMVQTLQENEKNLEPLSGNINGSVFRPGLLDESKADLLAATSVDYDGKYWICAGSKVWVWDYTLSPFDGRADDMLKWFPYDNINARCWLINDRTLYHGDRQIGRMTKFIPDYNDYGQPIKAVFRCKLFNFDFPEWLKTITGIWMTTRSGSNTTITLNFYDDNNVLIESRVIKSKSFDLSSFSLDNFTVAVYRFPITIFQKLKQKKIANWQFEVSNNELNKNLSIMSVVIGYELDKKMK